MKSVSVVYVDVDDTLVRSIGAKRVLISATINRVKQLAASSSVLYCWSSGGGEYAKESAIELGIESCFKGFLPKPSIMIDDQHPRDWRKLTVVHPFCIGVE